MDSMFTKCKSLKEIPLLDTRNVMYTNYMFADCESLTSIPHINTENVINMRYMFSGCKLIESIPQLDTSNTKDMSYIFNKCEALKEISWLNTKNVKYMNFMFNDCKSLEKVSSLDISNAERYYMFSHESPVIKHKEYNSGDNKRIMFINPIDERLIHIGCFSGTRHEAIEEISKKYSGIKAKTYINKVNKLFERSESECSLKV